MERCETFHDYYLIEVYTPLALTVTGDPWDNEWGKPVHDENKLFEMLILEGMQAGLSWLTILNKREAFRIAFDNFDCKKR